MQPCALPVEPVGSVACDVTRHRHGDLAQVVDRVVDECPVALVFNDISHAVMMATPIDLDVFGLGFALSEGIVERASDVFDIESECTASGAVVRLTVAQQAFMALKARRRALAGRTGCGVCGIESLEQLDLHPPRIRHAGAAAGIGADAVERASRALPAHQELMRDTGGIHAAAWCSRDGAVIDVFEDVGRHNALDKLIGQLAQRLRVPVEPRQLRARPQGRAPRHPDGRDDLRADVARDRRRARSRHPPARLLPRRRLRRIHRSDRSGRYFGSPLNLTPR